MLDKDVVIMSFSSVPVHFAGLKGLKSSLSSPENAAFHKYPWLESKPVAAGLDLSFWALPAYCPLR